jgi:putative (di)nucleoside polyphosphate hydrolase
MDSSFVVIGGRNYRRNVAILPFTADGRMLVCRRRDFPAEWQFPQGGIESGEDARYSALRELFEETGIRSVRRVLEGEMYVYDFPYPFTHYRTGELVVGQQQKWYAAEFAGPDSELVFPNNEFIESKWIPFDPAFADGYAEFKRVPAQRAMKFFAKKLKF